MGKLAGLFKNVVPVFVIIIIFLLIVPLPTQYWTLCLLFK